MRSEEEIRFALDDLSNWDTHGQPIAEEKRGAIRKTLKWVLNDKGEK